MRRIVLGIALLFACARPIEPGDEAADEGISDTQGEDTLGSGEVVDFPEFACDPTACTQSCWNDYDLCGHSLQGTCSDVDTCVCEPAQDCLPCAEQDCDNYEVCGTFGRPAEFGTCHLPCSYEFEYPWDPELGCMIPLPQDLHSLVLPFFFVEIMGIGFSRAEGCGNLEKPDAFVLDEQALTLTLCGEACSQFESVGSLETGWGIPCE